MPIKPFPVPHVRVSPYQVARRLRAVLTEPRAGRIKVYDAQGQLIAEIDPVTRRRTPVRAPRR